MDPTDKKPSHLAKTVLTNLAQDLEKYEERDLLYEISWIFTSGKVPTHYHVIRALALGSKFLRNVTKERES